MNASVDEQAKAMVARIQRWIDEHPDVDPNGPEMKAGMREICVEFGIDPDKPMRVEAVKTGRNEPCPCGSGIKFKRCHGR